MGDLYAGLLGNDDEWVRGDQWPRARRAATTPGALPLHERLRTATTTHSFADVKNSSDYRQASPILRRRPFSQTFAGEGPWAHLDIAGTAFLERGRGDYYKPFGATGYGVRLLAELARRLSG